MASFNKVILVGNLTRDPQVRYTPGGTAVAEIGMAVSRQWFDKQTNSRREETTFVDVTLWGRQAEVAGEYLAKGRPVLIEGRLQLDTWDDKETGQKRSKLRVIGESMQMLGSRSDGGGGQGGGGGGQRRDSGRPAAPQQQQPQDAGSESFSDSTSDYGYGGGPPDDEVPF
ncbi:single-stranded DNA-binding protein [Planctellipticum variicoloris]|uniref:single-stranded DNA-binding protein n=1 Tax=Planctellipticum variicoloris TaxID=3064265 RepID=UPI002B8C5A6A|nr:single-stranded DNA-binding protein [Planctomycetaceae bacterium SH412]HTN03960.1 single-stranded DNA-binding protein [Planctomycetaceae bacterium]